MFNGSIYYVLYLHILRFLLGTADFSSIQKSKRLSNLQLMHDVAFVSYARFTVSCCWIGHYVGPSGNLTLELLVGIYDIDMHKSAIRKRISKTYFALKQYVPEH